jgi:hypothetical protein
MLTISALQSSTSGEPSDHWFSKLESEQSFTDFASLRSERLAGVGVACSVATRTARTEKMERCIFVGRL